MGKAVAVESVGYSVSAVARRLGVAPSTLRTWDRRYGMSPSLRTSGAHRRYTAQDVSLLERMHGLMVAGMPPGDASRAVLNTVGPVEAAPRLDTDDGIEPTSGSGNVVPLRSLLAQQRGLDRAALALDTNAAAEVIRGCIAAHGVTRTWEQVIAPVLRTIGERYDDTDPNGGGIDIEHHLSHVIAGELIRHTQVRDPVNPRPVLLAAAPEEQHTLPLYALAAALAEQRVASKILGGRTPDRALAAAVRRTGPVAVFVWAQARPTTDLAMAVPPTRPAAALFLGGPGWAGTDLRGVSGCPSDLVEAVLQLSASARGQRV